MDYLGLGAFFLITFIAAISGGYFRPGDFYKSLNKPSWNPPDWLFAPAWFVLYFMIAIAGWLVWMKDGFALALLIWCIQIVLNALWSYLAFGLNRLDLAFYEVVALWTSIAAFIFAALPIDQTAALLFIPYILWVSFAAALNYTVWQMNPETVPRGRT
ncbi:MAG: tryptophan-rich sensory protein [Alphaproteobacteria bacterium]|nr:tryptophan-rich sensory protein [Alphaproteobacteria bacterium]